MSRDSGQKYVSDDVRAATAAAAAAGGGRGGGGSRDICHTRARRRHQQQ